MKTKISLKKSKAIPAKKLTQIDGGHSPDFPFPVHNESFFQVIDPEGLRNNKYISEA